MQVKLNRQSELDAEEQNGLRLEIESLEKQLREKDLVIIGREKQLNLQKNKVESDKRKFIAEKDITIAQLEVERQTNRVSRQIVVRSLFQSITHSSFLQHLLIKVMDKPM